MLPGESLGFESCGRAIRAPLRHMSWEKEPEAPRALRHPTEGRASEKAWAAAVTSLDAGPVFLPRHLQSSDAEAGPGAAACEGPRPPVLGSDRTGSSSLPGPGAGEDHRARSQSRLQGEAFLLQGLGTSPAASGEAA